jgi:hypothetical protein
MKNTLGLIGAALPAHMAVAAPTLMLAPLRVR